MILVISAVFIYFLFHNLFYICIIVVNLLLVNTFVLYFLLFYKRGDNLQLTERIKMLATPLNMTFASIEREVGFGRGTIRKWDENSPSVDRLLKVANLLHTSIDYLMTGENITNNTTLSSEEKEWLELIHQLPEKKRIEFKGELKGYIRCMNESSVAAENLYTAKTGTDSLGK